MSSLDSFFDPESIAVVGASNDPDKLGYTLVRNLHSSYDGPIYPVNPNAEEIHGQECYESITTVPGDVELAILVVPAGIATAVVDECADAGVDAVLIGSGGFADAGEEGEDLQAQVVERAHEANMRVWGPQGAGIITSDPSLSTAYLMETAGHIPESGNVSIISQSGILVGAMYLQMVTEEALPVGNAVAIGNRADVEEAELVEYYGSDETTDVIGMYLESIKEGRHFRDALDQAAQESPVVVLKGGRSDASAAAAASHTGSIAGDDRIADAVFEQHGATRVDDYMELLDYCKGFSNWPAGMPGDNVAVLTMTGGGGVIAADLMSDHGLEMADLQPETIAELEAIFPDWFQPENPVDIWATILEQGIDRTMCHCLEALLSDDGVDGILLQPEAFAFFEDFDFDAFLDIAAEYDTPIVSWMMGEADHMPYWIDNLEEGGIPVYRDLQTAVGFMAAARDYADWRERRETAQPKTPASGRPTPAAITDARAADRRTLTEAEAKRVLEAWDIPTTEERVVTSADAAVQAANEIGYPVALKVSSADITHKSDIGAIELDIHTPDAVRTAYDSIRSATAEHAPDATIDGVLVQQMVQDGTEVIVGVNNDPTFGPTILFGLGGVFVEVLEDVALRQAPLSEADARAMISDIDGAPVLRGARGGPPADIDALVEVLQSTSSMAMALEDDIAELDINPLMVFPDGEGVCAADALLRLTDH